MVEDRHSQTPDITKVGRCQVVHQFVYLGVNEMQNRNSKGSNKVPAGEECFESHGRQEERTSLSIEKLINQCDYP